MNKQKVGLVMFWIAVVWAIGWGIIGSLFVTPALRNLTMDELNQTMWALTGPWFLIWGIFGVPVGAVLAMIGACLSSGVKRSTIGVYGVIGFLVLALSMSLGFIGHIPLLFGIGGTLILLFYIGILRLWAKERPTLKDAGAAAADLKLVGYTFFVITAWFVCGFTGAPFLKALEGVSPSSPLHIIILFVSGWFFLFMGYRKAQK